MPFAADVAERLQEPFIGDGGEEERRVCKEGESSRASQANRGLARAILMGSSAIRNERSEATPTQYIPVPLEA